MNLLEQTQNLLLTRQVEVIEAENLPHDEVEEWQILQQRSKFSKEKMTEATQGFQGTLQER